jgi:hypothetical protein
MSTPLSACPPGDTHSLLVVCIILPLWAALTHRTHSLIAPTHYNIACFTCTVLNSC